MGAVAEGSGLDQGWILVAFLIVIGGWLLATLWVLRVHLALGSRVRLHWAFQVAAALVLIRILLGLGVPEVPESFDSEALREMMLAWINVLVFLAAADVGITAFLIIGLIVMLLRVRAAEGAAARSGH